MITCDSCEHNPAVCIGRYNDIDSWKEEETVCCNDCCTHDQKECSCHPLDSEAGMPLMKAYIIRHMEGLKDGQ